MNLLVMDYSLNRLDEPVSSPHSSTVKGSFFKIQNAQHIEKKQANVPGFICSPGSDEGDPGRIGGGGVVGGLPPTVTGHGPYPGNKPTSFRRQTSVFFRLSYHLYGKYCHTFT